MFSALLLLLLFPLLSFPKSGRAETTLSNALSFEPLSVVFSRTVILEYERTFGHFSASLGLSFGTGTVAHESLNQDFTSLGGVLSFRFRPWNKDVRGAFIGPYAALVHVDSEFSGLAWTAGLMAGYTWVLGGSFLVSTGLGLGYSQHDLGAGEKAWLPAVRVSLGAAF